VKLTHQGNWNWGHIVIPIQNFGDVEVPSLSFFSMRTNRVILGYSRAYPCWPILDLCGCCADGLLIAVYR
jgi:hypothetical protein